MQHLQKTLFESSFQGLKSNQSPLNYFHQEILNLKSIFRPDDEHVVKQIHNAVPGKQKSWFLLYLLIGRESCRECTLTSKDFYYHICFHSVKQNLSAN